MKPKSTASTSDASNKPLMLICTPDCSIQIASAEPRAVPAAIWSSPGRKPPCFSLTSCSLSNGSSSFVASTSSRRELTARCRM